MAEILGMFMAIIMFAAVPIYIGVTLAWMFCNRGKRVWSALSALALVMYLLGTGIVDLFENEALRIYTFFAGFSLLVMCGVRALIR